MIVFAVAFSLATIPGPLASNFHLPSVSIGHANAASNQPWLPAGPASNTETTPIFIDQTSEFNNIQTGTPPGSGSSIDLTDQQLSPGLIPTMTSSSQFLVTPQIKEHGWFELEFDLSNNFWGCSFNFGNSTCGVQIRQGLAHLIDKSVYVTHDSALLGTAVPLDVPVTLDNGGLLTPNNCGWDLLYPQTTNCIVGTTDPSSSQFTEGTAYHWASAPATGANGLGPGAQANPSMDFCAAAGHMIAAGLATTVVTPPTGGFPTSSPSTWNLSGANCVLSGVSANVAAHVINLYIRSDDPRRLDLGNLMQGQICLLFTGSTSLSGCTSVLTTTLGPITLFQGFLTSPTAIQNNWWMYTAAFLGGYPADGSLFFGYHSQFVSGFTSIQQPPIGPSTGLCSDASVGSFSASNYQYVCDPNYDSLSSQMEFAPCLVATGDPTVGQTSATFGTCPGSSSLSWSGAGLKTEDRFGSHEFTIPVFNALDQFGYLNNGWLRPINAGTGLANFYTWLDAWNPSTQTIRQGFKETTRQVSPYIASTVWDFFILGNIMDSLGATNPYQPNQLLNYMTVSQSLVCNSASACISALTYQPPSGTSATYRYTLRSDLFFHDGRQVTAFDVAGSYLSLKATGAFQGSGAAPMLAITVLSPTQFDINLSGNGAFTIITLDGLTVMAFAYWSGVGATAWNSAVSACTSGSQACFPAQYGLGAPLSSGVPGVVCNAGTGLTSCPFATANLNVDSGATGQVGPSQIGASYNSLAAGVLIGSGAWMCVSSTGVRGAKCDTNAGATINPGVGDAYTMTRFGTGHAPGTSLTDSYFRSNGALALWAWAGDTGDFTHDFLNFGVVAKCVGASLGTTGCTQWQQGIGGEVNGNPTIVQPIPQASIVARFVGVDFVSIVASPTGPNPTAPWTTTAIPMIATGTGTSFDGFAMPVLYEGTQTLNPASAVGCSTAPGAGYPTAGYDC